MATARLTDSQKQELVVRFQRGENTLALAGEFGCSPTTVTRLVRAEMGDEAYAVLRDERQKKGVRDRQIPLAIGDGSSEQADDAPADAASGGEPALASPAVATPQPSLTTPQSPVASPGAHQATPELEETEPLGAAAGHNTVLAIDDADDFSDEDDETDGVDELTTEEDEEDIEADRELFQPVAVLPIAVDDQGEIQPAPWSPEQLPSCAYLLVDKTVELQARPLGEIPELGRLPSEELDRQALVLFTNPRQAKRQCGRTQRVIKVPDPSLLGRTAPYLLAQGISRVVIEGTLYALPENQ